jgi:hypothetical protein
MHSVQSAKRVMVVRTSTPARHMSLPLGVCCRTIILRRKNSTEWAFWSLPVLAFITVFINIFFVLVRGHLP